MPRIKTILAIPLFSLTQLIASTNIAFTVSPQSTVSPNNRPAVFNWLVESSNGSEARIGQYACGSYWVAPAIGDNGVKILSITGSSTPGQIDLIAMDDDPMPHSHGLLHLGTRTYGSNDSTKDEIPSLPKSYIPGSALAISLVAAMQRNEIQTSKAGTKAIEGGAIDAYCVLTVVSSPPPENGTNSIRPNIVGDSKEFLTWSDFNLNKLPSHSFIGSRTSTLINSDRIKWNHSTEIFSMKTWDGNSYEYYSEGGRAFRPHILHHNYAAGRMQSNTGAIISMLGTNSIEEKKPLLASLISSGLDVWHFRYNRANFPGAWESGAGQWGGQFTPAAFATALLVDNSKANRMKKTVAENFGSNPETRGPQEMRQIIRGQTGVLLWGDDHDPLPMLTTEISHTGFRRYWQELKDSGCFDGAINNCNPAQGQKTRGDPHGYIDGPGNRPGYGYFSTTLGGAKAMAALMILFPDFREIVNYDDIIEYSDRISRAGIWSQPDPVAAPPPNDQGQQCSPWEGGAGCSGFRTTWGPSLIDSRYAVENGVGRFPSSHGTQTSIGYSIDSVESNWSSIISLYDGKTYEDTFTPIGQVVSPDIYVYPEGNSTIAQIRAATFDSTIYYTTDGSTPTSSSTIYTTPFTTNSPQLIKAIATKPGLSNSKISTHRSALSFSQPPNNPTNLISN